MKDPAGRIYREDAPALDRSCAPALPRSEKEII